MPAFRYTFKMEVYIEAESQEEAQQVYESINLGTLQADMDLMDELTDYGFVETVSIDKEDE